MEPTATSDADYWRYRCEELQQRLNEAGMSIEAKEREIGHLQAENERLKNAAEFLDTQLFRLRDEMEKMFQNIAQRHGGRVSTNPSMPLILRLAHAMNNDSYAASYAQVAPIQVTFPNSWHQPTTTACTFTSQNIANIDAMPVLETESMPRTVNGYVVEHVDQDCESESEVSYEQTQCNLPPSSYAPGQVVSAELHNSATDVLPRAATSQSAKRGPGRPKKAANAKKTPPVKKKPPPAKKSASPTKKSASPTSNKTSKTKKPTKEGTSKSNSQKKQSGNQSSSSAKKSPASTKNKDQGKDHGKDQSAAKKRGRPTKAEVAARQTLKQRTAKSAKH